MENTFAKELPEGTPTLAPAILGVSISLMIVGTVMAVASMARQIKRPRAVDWITLLALMFTIGNTALLISDSSKEVHQWDTSITIFGDPSWLAKIYAGEIVVSVDLFLVKTAIIALYLSIFSVSTAFKIAAAFALLLNIGVYVPALGVVSKYCAPAPGIEWNLGVAFTCQKPEMQSWLVASGTLAVALDIFIFILPIPIVTRLALPMKRKVGVLAVFGTGFLGIVASVVSLAYKIKLRASADKTWDGAVVLLCSVAETWIGLMVASMPGFAGCCKLVVRGVRSSGAFSSLRSPSHSAGSGKTSSSAHAEKGRSIGSHSDADSQRQLGPSSSRTSPYVGSDDERDDIESGLYDASGKHPLPIIRTEVSVSHEFSRETLRQADFA